MPDPNLSLEHAITLFTIFEGLALWKLPEFLKKDVQQIDFEGCCKKIWGDCKDQTFSKKCFKATLFVAGTLLFKLMNTVSFILRWTPVAWGVLVPIVVFRFAVSSNVETIYSLYSNIIYSLFFLFMAGKTLLCILAAVINWLYMKRYKKYINNVLPEESVLSTTSFTLPK